MPRFATLLTIAVAGAAVASVAQQQTAYTIAWKPVLGEQKYKIAMDSDGGQMKLAMQLTILDKIVKIEDGKVTSESKTQDFHLWLGEEEMKLPEGQGPGDAVVTTVRSLKGGLVEQKGAKEGQQEPPRVRRLQEFNYPEKPVELEGSWFKDFAEDKAAKLPAARAKYTLTAIEDMNKVSCYKIDYAFSELDGEKPMGALGTFWLERSTGNLVKLTTVMNDVSFAPMMPAMNMKVSMTRVQ